MEYTFSLSAGKRIAIIKGGKNAGRIIYLYDKKHLCCGECKKKECKKKCCDNCCYKFYHKRDEREKDTLNIVLEEGEHFEELPTNDPNQVSIDFISGRAGSGKSYYLKQVILNYKKIYPENKVYLFSESKSDKVLDDIVKRIPLDKFAEESDLTWDKFDDCVFVCFDDIDQLENSRENNYLRKKLYHLMNSLIQNARKKHIQIAQTAHIATDGATTKVILNSASNIIIFLNSISMQHKRMMKDYLGISKENIKKILNMKGRWVCIFTCVPMCIMGEQEIYILNNK